MKIRSYTDDDYYFTRDLHRENMLFYIDKYWGGWDSEVYKKDVLPDNTWIVEYNGEKAGFFVLTFDGRADLTNIQIRSSFRNMGLGTQIIKYCESKSIKKGFSCLFLQAFRENRARHLYERIGFKTFDITNSHYLMKKEFNKKPNLAFNSDG